MRRGIASGKSGPAWGTRVDLAGTLDEPLPEESVRLWTDDELAATHAAVDAAIARAHAVPYRVTR